MHVSGSCFLPFDDLESTKKTGHLANKMSEQSPMMAQVRQYYALH